MVLRPWLRGQDIDIGRIPSISNVQVAVNYKQVHLNNHYCCMHILLIAI